MSTNTKNSTRYYKINTNSRNFGEINTLLAELEEDGLSYSVLKRAPAIFKKSAQKEETKPEVKKEIPISIVSNQTIADYTVEKFVRNAEVDINNALEQGDYLYKLNNGTYAYTKDWDLADSPGLSSDSMLQHRLFDIYEITRNSDKQVFKVGDSVVSNIKISYGDDQHLWIIQNIKVTRNNSLQFFVYKKGDPYRKDSILLKNIKHV